jgi:FkbM family methyltransferase
MTRHFLSYIRDLNIIGSGKISRVLSRLLLPAPKGPVVTETLYGFRLHLDPVQDHGVERSIYYFGTYEKGTLHILDHILAPGDVFVDVGANIGLMSVFASQKVGEKGRVVSFEPNPKTRAILQKNISLNHCTNIRAEAFALSEQNKKSRIYDRWDVNRGGASLIAPEKPTDSYEIEETTFSDFFADTPSIKLVKIDVEGYELNVLKGARKYLLDSPNPPSLVVEFSSDRVNTFGKETVPLFTFLKDLNIYRFFTAEKGKERISALREITHEKQLPTHDNVFCFTKEQLKQLPKKLFTTPL